MTTRSAIFFGSLMLGAAVFAGCEAFIPVPASQVPKPPPKPPFAYEPLGVRNSCMVESIHFYDIYNQKEKNATDAWARIMSWGMRVGDFNVGACHAIAVFSSKSHLWEYDINFGFQPLNVPTERRGDVTDVSPAVTARYPASSPVFVQYWEDYYQDTSRKRPDFLFYHANPDVRDATRVASELGRFRPVRVVEFSFPENGQIQASAATVFIFSARLCIYFPRRGTFISPPTIESPDNLRFVTYVIQNLHPGARDVHWQPGGYLLFPPKT